MEAHLVRRRSRPRPRPRKRAPVWWRVLAVAMLASVVRRRVPGKSAAVFWWTANGLPVRTASRSRSGSPSFGHHPWRRFASRGPPPPGAPVPLDLSSGAGPGDAFGDAVDDAFDSGFDPMEEAFRYEGPGAAPVGFSAASASVLLEGLNPSQVEAVTQPLVDPEFHEPVVTRVIAGPGSGKTKVLTTRIAHLLQTDPTGKILAVTFTRKAAGEMRERLEKLLVEQEEHHHAAGSGEAADWVPEEGGILQETAGPIGGGAGAGEPSSPRGIERVELGTFHSICAKVLRYNGELLGDLPSVLRDMSKAKPVLVEKIPQGGGSAETDDGDDDSGDGTEGPEMVLVDPEIRLNGQYAIIDQGEQVRVLNECLKERKIDLKNTELKPIQIISSIGKMKEIFAQGGNPLADGSKEEGGPGKAGPAMRMARKVYFPYREKLLSNNVLDFDDLILLTRELLMEHEDLRTRLHRRWPHVLVDEYQDTSRVQMDLIKLLTSSSLFVVGDADQSIYSWRGAHVGSLQEVSTEFQAYGVVKTVFLKENYRSTSNIVRAAEKVISSGIPSKPKSAVSLALAEAGIDEEEGESTAKEGSPTDELRRAMKPKRGAGPTPRVVACEDERGESTFVVDTILNMTEAGDVRSGDTVAVIYRTNAQSRYLEEACVQKNLPYVIRGGAGGFYKRAEIRDCLCFLRWLHNGNDEGSMVRAMKTPSKGIGEKGFGEFKEYCGLVESYFRQHHPGEDKPTYLDLLVSMTNGGRNATREDIDLPDGTPMASDHVSKRAMNSFVRFSAQMREIRAAARTKDVGELLLFVIEELGLIDHFDAISKSSFEFLERKENVQELRNAAKKYASYGPALGSGEPTGANGDDDDDDEVLGDGSGLSTFLDDVALVSDTAEASETEDDKLVVNLMTIHASKGTEFDCVFVVGLEEGTLPCNPALQEGDGSVQLEEEKRLCYVAMTRAKTRLVLTWRKEVTGFFNWSNSGSKTKTKKRSRFLDAIVSKKSRARGKAKAGRGTGGARGPSGRYGRINRTGLGGPSSAGGRKAPFSGRGTPPPKQRQPRSAPGRGTRPARPGEPPYDRPSADRVEALRSTLGPSPLPRKAPPKASRPTPTRKTAARKPRAGAAPPGPPSRSVRSGNRDDTGIDPTWFFPVGIKVVHVSLGKGTVLEPPPFSRIEDAKVRVRFDSGKTLEFPALGTDILPDMGGF
ncbi:unnamed protein product [Pseudo-nitzschia multistriata]|uniref:DNA 3'-5' helicase n=1 Tax=Pseudo-nitzschia multistriata TaxID=183589 RepID=A0A448ZR84_9STRA|nr:unnamed protein product [Pseudo-nitzschia multistriata]